MGRLVSRTDINKGRGKAYNNASSSKDSKNGSVKISLNLIKRDKTEILSSKNPAYNYLAL